MINLHESYMARLGFELMTPGFSVRLTADCASEATGQIVWKQKIFHDQSPRKLRGQAWV